MRSRAKSAVALCEGGKKTVMILAIIMTLSFTAFAADEDEPKVRKVALTFDDGPSAKYTPQILDILKKNEVKATFFVLGKCVKLNPDVLRRAYAEGHFIGNHTYHHVRISDLVGSKEKIKELVKEIKSAEKIIKETICGDDPNCEFEPPKFMRPPYGAKNKKSKEIVKSLGYKMVLWNVSSNDCEAVSHKLGWKAIFKSIFDAKRKRRNKEIVLMHDSGGNRTYDVQALPQIITKYKKLGYEFVTVDGFYTAKED